MIKEEAIEILSDMRAEYNIFSDDEEETTRYHALSWAIQALNERTGRWIPVAGRMGKEVQCDCCGEVFWYWLTNFTYCPNCGAQMEVEEDE